MKRALRTSYSYQLVLRPEPEGGYTVIVPSLPGCVSYGRTVEEANEMAEDAIRGYLASLRKHGEQIPAEDRGNIIATATVSVKVPYAEIALAHRKADSTDPNTARF